MKSRDSSIAFLAVVLACCAAPAQALQPLCNNSPESPTVVLGLLGAAAAGYPYLRGRAKSLLKRRSRSGQLPD